MVSPTTLVRRAAKAKTPAAAKRLRAQAAKMRREKRNRAPVAERKDVKRAQKAKNTIFKTLLTDLVNEAIPTKLNQEASLGWRPVGAEQPIGNQAGVGRLQAGTEMAVQRPEDTVPTVPADTIERIKKLARARSDGGLGIALRSLFTEGRAAGRKLAGIERDTLIGEAHERLSTQIQANNIKTVCSFMCRIKGMEDGGKGLPPFFVLDGWTAARVYDALREAGYTTEGKQGGIRKRDY